MALVGCCCVRLFVDGAFWGWLLIAKRGRRRYALYTDVDRLPSPAFGRLLSALRPAAGACDPCAPSMDANRLDAVVRALECSGRLRRSVVRRTRSTVVVPAAAAGGDDQCRRAVLAVRVKDIRLAAPVKHRLAYTWCEMYEKTDFEYRQLENIMAWLSTLGGAFSSLGDHTEHCAIKAGEISLQQLRIAVRIGDPLTVARCKLYAAISLMQRGYFKQAKFIIQSQYVFIKSQLNVDARLVKMCQGIWTKLKYEWSKKKMLKKKSNTVEIKLNEQLAQKLKIINE